MTNTSSATAAALLEKVNCSSITILPTASQRKSLQNSQKQKETAGPGWFDLPAPEMTPELEKDLKVLSMRGALDRKRFYRGGEQPGKSKYFQVGTIQESKAGFYGDRLTKRERPKSFVDGLLKDQDSQAYYRKKFNELQAKYQKNGKRPGGSKGTVGRFGKLEKFSGKGRRSAKK